MIAGDRNPKEDEVMGNVNSGQKKDEASGRASGVRISCAKICDKSRGRVKTKNLGIGCYARLVVHVL